MIQICKIGKEDQLMEESSVAMQEFQRASFKKIMFYVSAVLFAGLLMLAANYAESRYAGVLLASLFGREFFDVEWKLMLANTLLYLFLLLIPSLFLLLVFRMRPTVPFSGPVSTTPYPFLYLPMCIGVLYLLNLVVIFLFGELLKPFAQGDSYYPLTLPGMLLYFLNLGILPALFEEGLFRGIMLRQMLPVIGKWPAIFVSAFIFGLMHLDPSQSVFAFGFGLLVGYAYVSTGSIWFGVLIHMLNNMISGCANYWLKVYVTDANVVEISKILLGLFEICMMLFGLIALAFYVLHVQRQKQRTRRTGAERLLPSGTTVLRITLCSPVLYLLLGAYVFLLWLFFFASPV